MAPDGPWYLTLPVQDALFFSAMMDGGLHFQDHFDSQQAFLPWPTYYNLELYFWLEI